MTGPLQPTSRTLETIAERQIRRDGWPEFEHFDRDRYSPEIRGRAARQWWRRAHEEYGSIHEFTLVAHAMTRCAAPVTITGALARLITDEVRHAALCARMAQTLLPAEEPEWPAPRAPFPDPPAERDRIFAWAADAILCSCCLGETISRPLYESLATLITDPVPESVVRQILKDEHLHARFGWETLEWLWPRLGDEERAWLQRRLARRLAGFELSCAPNHRLEDLVGEEICVEAPPADAPPNLGHLPSRTYAGIFYATLEAEIFPHFQAIGLDPMLAWQERAAAYRQKW